MGIRAIFDPERGFDPSTLPENVQSLYAETKAAMDAAEAMAPEGAFRGCEAPIPGWCHVDIPNELYEAVRTCTPNQSHLSVLVPSTCKSSGPWSFPKARSPR